MAEKTSSQAVKFGAVGLINTFIDYLVLNVLVFMGLTATLTIFGTPMLIANFISVTLAMVNSFILNRFWAFKSQADTDKTNIVQEILKFVIVTVFSAFVINQVIFNIFYTGMPWLNDFVYSIVAAVKLNGIFSPGFVSLNMAKVFATVASLIWNFFAYKFFVFKK